MRILSKEYTLNKISASIVPNIGKFRIVSDNHELVLDKLKRIDTSLNSDTLDEASRSTLELERTMLAQALKWMGIQC